MGRGTGKDSADGFTRLLGARRGSARREDVVQQGTVPEEPSAPAVRTPDPVTQMAAVVHEAPALPDEVEAAGWAVEEMSERTEEGYGPKRHGVEPEEAERRDEALRAAYDRHSVPVEHRKLGY